MTRGVGMRQRPRAPLAHHFQARGACDFDVADPKWWYKIFDATSLFRFAGVPRSDITTCKAGGSPRIEERVLTVEGVTRFSNFWALTARSMIGKSWKTVEIVEFWPGLSRRRSRVRAPSLPPGNRRAIRGLAVSVREDFQFFGLYHCPPCSLGDPLW